MAKGATRAELLALVERLRRSCVTLHTERVSFISDKSAEVLTAVEALAQVRPPRAKLMLPYLEPRASAGAAPAARQPSTALTG